MTASVSLELGSNVIELLIPQRRPFLMVDHVRAFGDSPLSLEASRHISANEPVFAGHFPGLHIWPGVLTIEGLGQTTALLLTLREIRQAFVDRGLAADAAFEALRNLDLGFRAHPGHKPAEAAAFLAEYQKQQKVLAVGVAVEVKLLQPVFAGQRLDYRVIMVHELGDFCKTEVEASVGGRVVASGIMTGARLQNVLPLPLNP